MKKTLYILTLIFMASCGSSKKVVQQDKKPESPTNVAIEVDKDLLELEKALQKIDKTRKDSIMTMIDDRIRMHLTQGDTLTAEKLRAFKIFAENEFDKKAFEMAFQKDPISESDDVLKEKLEHKNETNAVFNHVTFDDLLKRHVSETGNVDYKAFKENRSALNAYLKQLEDNPPSDAWSREATLAFWINAYNAYTIKLIIDNYPTKSIKDIKAPWDYRFAKIGTKWYTLNDIEHKILRKMDEPRIHFAINCASVSCPKLLNEAFTAVRLEDQLTEVARGFLADDLRNEISENSVEISKIFRWFGKDFKQEGSLIDFLNTYSDIQISPKAKISYKDYDWSLNE
ncbi:DUF547 domain-containing protein [Sungkyunkwania multivorans]|uniref:DUF547 domain-containing protein n=1 Tax=Sungkyunkwania multivorans TaxID=1173618 RepID=A0ABW3D3E6_9FLAO